MSVSMTSAGIVYSASQTVTGQTGASVTHQVLDHYEEGTWSPKMDSPSVSTAPDGQSSSYTRIGNHVFVAWRFNTGANMAGATGYWRVQRLPFTSNSSYYTGAVAMHSLGFDTAEQICTYVTSSDIYFMANQNNAGWEDIGFGNGSSWYMMGSNYYRVA